MADTFTANYNLTKPQVGGDPDTWGDLLNTNFDAIDAQMKANFDLADAALPKAGGTMTGVPVFAPGGGGGYPSLSESWHTIRVGKRPDGGTIASILLNPLDADGGMSLAYSDATGLFSISDASAVGLPVRFSIARATGNTSVGGVLTVVGDVVMDSASSPQLFLDKPASGGSCRIYGRTNGGFRWLIALGDSTAESGANAGSDLSINRYDDTGAYLGTPFHLYRASGDASFAGDVAAGSFHSNTFAAGAGAVELCAATNNVYLRPRGPSNTTGQLTLNTSGVASAADFQATSDIRLKSNVRRLRRGLDELKRMLPREYRKGDRDEVGFIAQDVREVLPEAVCEGDDGYLSVSAQQVLALVANAVLELDERMTRAGV